ncbi:MAG: hypothetical protein IID41_00145 [Planctomycetes bacterium]|nr:hypothetical protein [Planctomycetota bacterium]
MSRIEDIKAILEVAEELYARIEQEYQRSLKVKSISPKLAVLIKNYLENLRSPLDYIAREISENTLGKSMKPYFPVACRDQPTFTKHMKKNLPDLQNQEPRLFRKIEQNQPFQPNGCKALAKLSELVNENKHDRLTEQTKTERRGLDIKFPGGAGISMGPGCSISGGGSISSGGGTFTPGGGSVSGDSPVRFGENIDQTVVNWVSFTFTRTGDDVLELLRDCRKDVDRIISDLRPILWP